MQDVNEWGDLRYMCSKQVGSKTNELVQHKARGLIDQQQLSSMTGKMTHPQSYGLLGIYSAVFCPEKNITSSSSSSSRATCPYISIRCFHLLKLGFAACPTHEWTMSPYCSIEKSSLVALVLSLWYAWNLWVNYTEEPYQHRYWGLRNQLQCTPAITSPSSLIILSLAVVAFGIDCR